jgi:hypothetical protein
MAANAPECLTVFTLPLEHRRRLRTSNLLERLNKEMNLQKGACFIRVSWYSWPGSGFRQVWLRFGAAIALIYIEL